MPSTVILTCEHATNRIPPSHRRFFPLQTRYAGPWGDATLAELLTQHWGYDIGALTMARRIARVTGLKLHEATISRLIIDSNRYKPASLFTAVSRDLPAATKRELLSRYYQPHRDGIEAAVRAASRKKSPVLHLGIHTFTPVFKNKKRSTDIGILYDPRRPQEQRLATILDGLLKQHLSPGWHIDHNKPYQGTDEGLSTYLRPRFPSRQFASIELEINQRHSINATAQWRELLRQLPRIVKELM